MGGAPSEKDILARRIQMKYRQSWKERFRMRRVLCSGHPFSRFPDTFVISIGILNLLVRHLAINLSGMEGGDGGVQKKGMDSWGR
ncbi:hypothetical protein CDAR_4521 [Caerostris darwini]|uniref:Uncharacterized protein n=1 Tax=Caerostris darwini TaxID=1538125 RepID=A0AAV4SPE3_9ARAC|nr:hypothetical protein CDAR_4521 [Caerostris darwini]